MKLEKLSVKFFVEPPDCVPLAEFIDVFHGWIQAGDGDYHDVADYSHMRGGPGIVLVAHTFNVSIDEAEGRRGLLFKQKRTPAGAPQDNLRGVVETALEHCRKLELEPRLKDRLRFATNEVVLWVDDRLAGTNSEECFGGLRSALEPLARRLYGGAEVAFEHDADPRKRLHARIRTAARLDFNTLCENLRNGEERASDGGVERV